jgi:hypothetical protein
VTTVNDPGHSHGSPISANGGGGPDGAEGQYSKSLNYPSKQPAIKPASSSTPSSPPSPTNIQVSLASNEDGEGYPLIYVLICQRALEN